ncbi:MAG: hypothetical protein WDN26_04975 [Chitinophagaceae bacterium]
MGIIVGIRKLLRLDKEIITVPDKDFFDAVGLYIIERKEFMKPVNCGCFGCEPIEFHLVNELTCPDLHFPGDLHPHTGFHA